MKDLGIALILGGITLLFQGCAYNHYYSLGYKAGADDILDALHLKR